MTKGMRKQLQLITQEPRVVVLCAVILMLGVITAHTSTAFLTAGNLRGMGLAAAITFLVGMGEAGVIVTRNIDASIGSMTGLTAFTSADLLAHHPGIGVGAVLAFALGMGAILGAINGLLVALLKLPSILVTLGTLFVYLGLLYMIAGDTEVSTSGLPASYTFAATGLVVGIPLICWYAAILGAALHIAARYTRRGRYWLAAGSNPAGARVLALRPERTILASYVLSGLCCGLVGVLWGGIYPTVTAGVASNLLLQVLAVVLVGGVSIWGGEGTVAGVALGSILFALLVNALIVLGVSSFWESAVEGALIVVTVSLNRRVFAALRSTLGYRLTWRRLSDVPSKDV
jgi:rhamnose transport system permease protein